MGEILDAALQRSFGDRNEPIRFVQIGGNDGVFEDPLHSHRVLGTYQFEWGQIYEPIPEYFDRLAENMKPFSYVTCHQLAVDDADVPGSREFNYVSPIDVETHRLPPSSKGIGSFSRERNPLSGFRYTEAKFRAIQNYIRTIEVETIPMTYVIEEYGAANLLLTDCEGYDLEVINSAFQISHFRPAIVQFEYLGLFDELFRETLNKLQAIGYDIVRRGKDVICELKSAS